MLKSLYVALPALVCLAVGYPSFAVSKKAEKPFAHMVFFTLKDHSKESVEGFIASCEKYLTKHEGTKYFSIGTRAEDAEEPVSVKDFDVALHVVFEDKSGRDKYLASERHDSFVAQVKDKFEKVRVFDSYLVKE
jgi:Stress responsive A/B Barrel Domain